MFGKHADEPDVLIAFAAFGFGHAFAGEPQELVVLGPGRNLHGDVARHRRDANFAAQNEIVDAHRQIDVQVVAAAFETRVADDVDVEIEIAVRTAAGARAALAGEADPLTVAHALGDRDLETLGLQLAAGSAAHGTDLIVENARSMAARADVVDLELNRFLAALERFGQREIDRRLQVAPAAREIRGCALTAPDAGEERIEEVREAGALTEVERRLLGPGL